MEVSKSLSNDRPVEILIAVRDAIHYTYLGGHVTYHFSCDLYETLLIVRNQCAREE